MGVLSAVRALVLWRELSAGHLAFPAWQAFLAVLAASLLSGFGMAINLGLAMHVMQDGTEDVSVGMLGLYVPLGACVFWVGFLLMWLMLHVAFKLCRSERRQLPVFRVAATASLAAALCSVVLLPFYGTVFWGLSSWFGGRALAAAAPDVRVGWATAIVLVLQLVAAFVAGLSAVLAVLGLYALTPGI